MMDDGNICIARSTKTGVEGRRMIGSGNTLYPVRKYELTVAFVCLTSDVFA